jgi:sterol desaturase/sphingolipid hydroxylase (fatty acid hydroxylase superfamily)
MLHSSESLSFICSHPVTTCLWTLMALASTMTSHSGYHLGPFMPDPCVTSLL